YAGGPNESLQFSTRSGSNETLTFENPRPGRWRIEVDGVTRYTDVTLTAELSFPALLTAGDSVTGLSGVTGSETLSRIPVPPGATALEVSTSGGIGNVDIYLKKGRPAVCQTSSLVSLPCRYDKASDAKGNAESIVIQNPEATDWYLVVSGSEGYAEVTLKTNVVMPATLQPGFAKH